MAETTETPTPNQKAKSKSSAATAAAANVFEFPKFDMPKFEVPTAFREMAEKSIAMAKDNYDKIKSTAEEATDVLEETCSTASEGCSRYGLKLIEAARTNTNATFDLFGELLGAKSYADVVGLTTTYMHKQFDAMITQAKELSAEAQKVATDTAAPIRESFTGAFSKAA